MRIFLFSLTCLCLALSSPLAAEPLLRGQSAGSDFQVELVTEGLGIPWGMAFVSPQKILLTERQGRIQLLDLKTGQLTPLTGGPTIAAKGQGGLLDVALPPDYQTGGWIYFSYSKHQPEGVVTTLARAKLAGPFRLRHRPPFRQPYRL